MRNLALILIASLISPVVWAGGAADIIGTAGSFSNNLGANALANRQLADQLYKQSLQDESNAWSGGIPNVSLLSKSLSESKDAKAADDQAKEFARAALHGAQTGSQSGDFALKNYGALSEDQLHSLATTSSPYMGQVQNKLGSYGLNLDADKMALKTPFGTFSTNISDSTLEKGLRGIATILGYNADDVSKGLAEAHATRDSLAQAAQSNLGTPDASNAADRQVASTSSAATAAQAASAAAVNGVTAATKTEDQNGMAPQSMAQDAKSTDWDKEEQAVLENRNRMKRAMGLSEDQAPLGHKDDDIFEMVHAHYQMMRSQGSFYEQDHIIEVTSNDY